MDTSDTRVGAVLWNLRANYTHAFFFFWHLYQTKNANMSKGVICHQDGPRVVALLTWRIQVIIHRLDKLQKLALSSNCKAAQFLKGSMVCVLQTFPFHHYLLFMILQCQARCHLMLILIFQQTQILREQPAFLKPLGFSHGKWRTLFNRSRSYHENGPPNRLFIPSTVQSIVIWTCLSNKSSKQDQWPFSLWSLVVFCPIPVVLGLTCIWASSRSYLFPMRTSLNSPLLTHF